MKLKSILSVVMGLAVGAGLMFAQTANTKQPTIKSEKEQQAIMAMFQAPDAKTRIQAAMDLITKFADTDFKSTAFYVAAVSAREIGDMDNMILYSEKALETDKQNYGAMLLLSSGLAQRTREFDLDKEEKLGRAEKLAKEAIAMLPTAPKPNPQITDEQWEMGKKDFISQGYESLGLAAMVRKNYKVCAENLTQAVNNAVQLDPALLVRQANCLKHEKKYDEAIASLDKALASPDAVPQVKQVATQEKIEINKLKGAAPQQ